MDSSQPGCSIHEIFQARILEWVVISFSRGSSQPGSNLGLLHCRQMLYYIENSKDSTKKLLELINEYSQVAGYKISTQKSLAFLYTNNEKTEREIKETIPFTIAMKRIKYLEINLLKKQKDLYIENYKTLMKEIKDDTNRWRNIPCLWIGRINIVEMSILPKAIYRFNEIPIKLPMVFFTELEQIISQFVWKYKKTSNSQSNLEKEEWNWRNQPNIKLYYKATVIKTVWY